LSALTLGELAALAVPFFPAESSCDPGANLLSYIYAKSLHYAVSAQITPTQGIGNRWKDEKKPSTGMT
jgi:hypothetical protein